MNRSYRAQSFDGEGRGNLPTVIKIVKNYLRSMTSNGLVCPTKIVFFTLKGEGPILAYNQLIDLDMKIIAVVFPATYTAEMTLGGVYHPEIPEKVRKFFDGVEIPVIKGRLPFDSMAGADAHNREMGLIKKALSVFGGSMHLAIQAILQATDAGLVDPGEEVIAVTSDTALLITAATSQDFLSPTCGLIVNEIICKPRNFDISRPKPKQKEVLQMPSPLSAPPVIEGNQGLYQGPSGENDGE